MREENLRKRDSQDGGRTETESNEKHTLIERAVMWLARNIALEKQKYFEVLV